MKRELRILVLPSAVEREDSAPTIHLKEVVLNLSYNHKLYLPVQQEHNIENDKNIYVKNLRLPHPQQTNLLSITIYKIYFFLLTLWYGILLASKFKCEVLYVRHGISTISGLLISKLKRMPIAIEINGIIADEKFMGRRRGGRFLRYLLFHLDKIACGESTKIISVTEELKRLLVRLYDAPPNKIIVIPNGVNIILFKSLNEKECKRSLSLDLNAKYVGFIGSLAPWQGVEYLIKSAPLILEEVIETKFLIVGDGVVREELEDIIRELGLDDRFIFTGTIPHRDVPKYINASEVCVVPKIPLKFGYSPLKLYEYMACRKPVIASRLSGFEILEQNNAGILVEPENSHKLAKAIIKMLKNKELREEMGRNGREVVVRKYSWKKVAENIEKVCMDVVYTNE